MAASVSVLNIDAAVGLAAPPKPRLAAKVQGKWVVLLAVSALLLIFGAVDTHLAGSRRYLTNAFQGNPFSKKDHPEVAAAVEAAATEAAVAVAAEAAAAAAPELAAGPKPALAAASYKELLRKNNLATLCSSEFRAQNAARVRNGSAPPSVMTAVCELGWCGGGFMSALINSTRTRPALAGLPEMVPCDLFKAIQGRTIWVLGDSQSQRFYTAARCFLDPFIDMKAMNDAKLKRVDVTTDPRQRKLILDKMVHGYTGGVEIPWCTHMVANTRLCHIRVNKGANLVEDWLPNLSLLGVTQSDILLMNFGAWHSARDKNYGWLVQRLADFYKNHRRLLPEITIWRDNNPQHFNILNGEFPHPDEAQKKLGKMPYTCVPMKGVELLPDGTLNGTNTHVIMGGWRNKLSEPIMRASGIHYLQTWNESVPLWGGHMPGECSHFCAPGAYNIWLYQLWAMLLDILPKAAR